MIDVIHTLDQLRDEGFFSDYAIGGGIATLFYTEPFATIDIDVFATIPPRAGLYDLSLIYARLQALGHAAEGAYVRIGDQPVQLLVPPTALEEEAVREAEWREIEGAKVKVFRPEHLVAIYLKIGRPKDQAKIAALLLHVGIARELLQDIIQRHNLQDPWNRYQKSAS